MCLNSEPDDGLRGLTPALAAMDPIVVSKPHGAGPHDAGPHGAGLAQSPSPAAVLERVIVPGFESKTRVGMQRAQDFIAKFCYLLG